MICKRFYHTDAVVLERLPDGTPVSTWFSVFPWASGAVLEGQSGKMPEDARAGEFETEGVS
jgi:hypothetical protein